MRLLKQLTLMIAVCVIAFTLVSCSGSSSNGGGMDGDADAASTFPYLGTWTGTWTNTTFGSSGALTVTIVDNGDGTVAVTVDLDGLVGGIVDPDPRTDNIAINSDGSASYADVQDMLGQMNVTLSAAGQLEINTPDIPTAGFDNFSATGSVTTTSASLTTLVNFTGGSSAVGTVTASKN